MLIGLYLSKWGGSPLVVGLEHGFNKIDGVCAEHFIPGKPYDYVMLFNQCAHTLDYDYGNLSNLNDYRVAFVDTAEYGFNKRIPAMRPLFYSTFASGAMKHDTKNTAQQEMLYNFLKGKSFPYFLREYLKSFNYPKMYHPVDYPLYHLSECWDYPNKEQYLTRQLNLFISWGASHPFRNGITQKLRTYCNNYEIYVLEEKTDTGITPRMPQNQYFDGMRRAKSTVSYDGYGSSSFRETEALCRTLLFKGETSIIQRDPLRSEVSCIEFKVNTNEDGTEFVDTNAAELINRHLQNPERCFEIYKNGYDHCMKHYTEKATAEYVLDIIKNHDWSILTPLLLDS